MGVKSSVATSLMSLHSHEFVSGHSGAKLSYLMSGTEALQLCRLEGCEGCVQEVLDVLCRCTAELAPTCDEFKRTCESCWH